MPINPEKPRGKDLEKWQKIEEIINRLIEQIFALFQVIIQKCTPAKVKSQVLRSREAIELKKKKVKSTLKNSKIKPKELANRFLFWLMDFIQKIKLISSNFQTKFKSIKRSEILMLIGAFFAPLLYKSKGWLASLRPEQIVVSIVGTAVFGLTTLGIVTSTSKIAEKQTAAREPASKVEEATVRSTRPVYYKLDEKRFKVMNVQVPIYVGGSNDLRKVTVDFTFISSNQYIKEYLYHNEYLIQDRLNTMVEPILPEFFLEEEGKRVLKEKIKIELNLLLKDIEVKGTIEEVHIDSFLAG